MTTDALAFTYRHCAACGNRWSDRAGEFDRCACGGRTVLELPLEDRTAPCSCPYHRSRRPLPGDQRR